MDRSNPYDGALMLTGTLPERVDFRRLAADEAVLRAQVPVSRFIRFADVLASSEGEVQVDLQGHVDEEGRRIVTGSAEANVQVFCQRCLEPMPLEVHADIALAVVSSEEQAKALPGRLDPLMQGGDPVDVYEILADELLLSMPIVSYHPVGECEATVVLSGLAAEADIVVEKPNPFAVLAGLKAKSSDS